jgi:aminopeptidase N
MLGTEDSAKKKIYFDAYRDFALSVQAVSRLVDVWQETLQPAGLKLSENDYITLATILAIKLPDRAPQIVGEQLEKIESEDRRRRFQWIAPALSAEQQVRDEFFYSLQDARKREIESWVLGALDALHHPLRREVSESYLLPNLELLQEIQVTGDIFFPARWLEASLGNYNSATAAATVRSFLAERPDYNRQLRLKILQAADDLFRAERLRNLQ